MQIRAENDPRYSRRFLIMGICAIGFALYCLYDGVIGYPARRAQGFEEFKSSDYKSFFNDARRKAMSLAEFEVVADREKRPQWETFAHDRDIPRPTRCRHAIRHGDGLRPRAAWCSSRFRSAPADDGSKRATPASPRVGARPSISTRWNSSTNANWRKKGIAKITYVADNRRRTFVLDDYKFDRYPTDAILYELEQRIDVERITGGPPEPPPEAPAERPSRLASATSRSNPRRTRSEIAADTRL